MAETIGKIIVDSSYFISGYAGSGVYELPEVVEIHGSQLLYLAQSSTINSWLSVTSSTWSNGHVASGTTIFTTSSAPEP